MPMPEVAARTETAIGFTVRDVLERNGGGERDAAAR
jgi:hypothetical protein